ncbi:hypothetical protein [Naasia aerilata]|uniref:Secreted protein n=1 Tax=Naasia aerilata TaxID=1162966 RepID=A0ABM8GAL4_9MICO|nr:hypothetical protein [Naasia aerilata]BDZ45207.1 hypothetical protein GCM10025866_11160 [Naasia aerilata]
MKMQKFGRRARRSTVASAVVLLVGTLVARSLGYSVGGRTVVRCRSGHLFTTWWIPGISVKSIRLGWWRLQRCPVGQHWTLVSPVRAADLSGRERRSAARLDTPLP